MWHHTQREGVTAATRVSQRRKKPRFMGAWSRSWFRYQNEGGGLLGAPDADALDASFCEHLSAEVCARVRSSFMTDEMGAMKCVASRDESTILYSEYDLDAIRKARRSFGLFRDRRPDQYQAITSGAGITWNK